MEECANCANTLRASSALTDMTEGTCPVTGYQKASVCVPVIVPPFAHTGKTVTKCCGEPVIVPGESPCPGKKNGTCAFTISQTICVEVPVSFGATATVGDTYVDCLGASTEDICMKCKEEEAVAE